MQQMNARVQQKGLTFFARDAGTAPSGTQRGTALRFQRGPIDIYFTSPIHDGLPTSAFDRLC